MTKIQGYKFTGTIFGMDTAQDDRYFVAGSRESSFKMIQAQEQCESDNLEIDTRTDYWFNMRSTIQKHKFIQNGTQQTGRPGVNDLAMNKCGKDYLAIGTTYGNVFVYDLGRSQPVPLFNAKGHDSSYQDDSGNIKKVVWEPDSTDIFYSSNFQNCIVKYDLRAKRMVDKHEYDSCIKFRDLKFNHDHKWILAASYYSDLVELFDIRNLQQSFISKSRGVVDQLGSTLDWDPFCWQRLASAGSKSINVWLCDGASLEPEKPISDLLQQDLLDHFSIKSFKWLHTKQSWYAISDHSIYFHDRSKAGAMQYMFENPNSREINCWLMLQKEQLILSASVTKETRSRPRSEYSNDSLIVAQFADNYLPPHDPRLNYPLSFTTDDHLALPLPDSSCIILAKNKLLFQREDPSRYDHSELGVMSLREELTFLHREYIRDGKPEQVEEHNAEVALRAGKPICYSFWKTILMLAFPDSQVHHTLDSIFEEKLKLDIELSENEYLLLSKKEIYRTPAQVNLTQVIQKLVDENELQTAVIASLYFHKLSLIPDEFLEKLLRPYIQLLRNLELYVIASQTILETNLESFKKPTQDSTRYSISCGTCKKSWTKGLCTCNLLCVRCHEKLNDRFVLWCKYCGHGGHAEEYKEWFKTKKECPHGCGHECFHFEEKERFE